MLQYALEVPKRVCVQFAVATYICSEVLIYIYSSSGYTTLPHLSSPLYCGPYQIQFRGLGAW